MQSRIAASGAGPAVALGGDLDRDLAGFGIEPAYDIRLLGLRRRSQRGHNESEEGPAHATHQV